MLSEAITNRIKGEARMILIERPTISRYDATILASVNVFVDEFDSFIDEILLIREAKGEQYEVQASIHEFASRREPLFSLITDIGLLITKKYPEISRLFFQEQVDRFKLEIKNLELTGRVKDVYDVQSDFHQFQQLTHGGILSNQLASALGQFEGTAPDYQRLYMSGLKSLGKTKTGRMIFDLLVDYGHGIAQSKQELANESKKHVNTITKGIDEILQNAGHLIRVVQRGNVDTYYIPDKFRKLHFS